MAKQYYIPGKEYEWTKETWEALKGNGMIRPFYGAPPKGKVGWSYDERYYGREHLDIAWSFQGRESNWLFHVDGEGIEIPECLIPFYGEKELKEILSVGDLEAGMEYIMCLGAHDERNIIYWGKNSEVIFITELLYHTYGHIFIKDIFHFRNIPEKTREEKLSEKYNVSLDTIKQMMEDGLIQEEED